MKGAVNPLASIRAPTSKNQLPLSMTRAQRRPGRGAMHPSARVSWFFTGPGKDPDLCGSALPGARSQSGFCSCLWTSVACSRQLALRPPAQPGLQACSWVGRCFDCPEAADALAAVEQPVCQHRPVLLLCRLLVGVGLALLLLGSLLVAVCLTLLLLSSLLVASACSCFCWAACLSLSAWRCCCWAACLSASACSLLLLGSLLVSFGLALLLLGSLLVAVSLTLLQLSSLLVRICLFLLLRAACLSASAWRCCCWAACLSLSA